MKWFFLFLFVLLLLIPLLVRGACSLLGGGVAGAAMDSYWVRREARDYRGFQDSCVTITREAVSVPNVRQGMDHVLDRFPQRARIAQDSDSHMGDLELAFHKQHLACRRAGTLLFEEQLPRAFYMHHLEVGRFRLADRDLLLVLTRSRSSTCRYFVGLYSLTGQRLLTQTISTGELWDCELTAQELMFLSPWQRIHISLR